VQSPKCGNGNEPLDKGAALTVLRLLLDAARGAEPDGGQEPGSPRQDDAAMPH
jgi:DEAD/DEAH box helicase domain-containing protein